MLSRLVLGCLALNVRYFRISKGSRWLPFFCAADRMFGMAETDIANDIANDQANDQVNDQALADIEEMLYHSGIEDDFFIGDYCLSFRTLSSAKERELWACYRNIRTIDQVYFVIDLLTEALHRVNGRRVDPSTRDYLAKEFFYRMPRSTLLGLYRRIRLLGNRIDAAQDAIDEYTQTQSSKSLWNIFKITGTLPSADFDFRQSNIIQHLWCITNHYIDENDREEASWKRATFVADQICAFLDPKAFQRIEARRGAAAEQKHRDKEVNLLMDIFEMMIPADRKEFIGNLMGQDLSELTMFSSRLPQRATEDDDAYRQRLYEVLEQVLEEIETQETHHTKVLREKEESMVVGFFREIRARAALRNYRILCDILADDFETADLRRIQSELTIAAKTRGVGWNLLPLDDISTYDPVMKCQEEYKFAAFVRLERRMELWRAILTEDLVELVKEFEPDIDPYLLRKANSTVDIGPRPPDEPSPPRGSTGEPPPPGDPGPAMPPGAPGQPAMPQPGGGLEQYQPSRIPRPASQQPNVASIVNEMADTYRRHNPGISDVADKIEIGEHIVETIGDWQGLAAQDAGANQEPPASLDEATTRAKQQSKDNKEYDLESNEGRENRREVTLGRRGEALDILKRAKSQAGITPEMERKAFLESLRQIAREDDDGNDAPQG